MTNVTDADQYTAFDVAVAYDCGSRAGYDRAIAEVVAWLRAKNLRTANYDADAIEAGEHRKGEA